MDRRSFLGAACATGLSALGANGCRSRPPISGEMLGPDIDVGHLLRDGATFPMPQTRHSVPIVIVGGGVAGLAAAWWLKRQGFSDFVLLESEAEVGGNARAGGSEVTRYPWGAHYLTLPSRDATDLLTMLEQFGILTGWSASGDPIYDERYLVHPPRDRLFVDGRWQTGVRRRATIGGNGQFGRFESLVESWRATQGRDGRAAFASPAALSSTDPEILSLDGVALADYLARQGLDDADLRWYVDYACRDDFGCVAADTSAWAGLHYFASRVPSAGYADDSVLTAPEGNTFFCAAMAQYCASHIATGHIAYRVEPDSRFVDVYCWNRERTSMWRARQVILAIPQFVVPHIMAGAATAGHEYAPWVVANLHVRQLPEGAGAGPAWDNVLHASNSLGYVTATNQLLRQHVGASVLTWYMPLTQRPAAAARRRLLAMSWQEWASIILDDLRPAHPDIGDLVTRIDVWRWGHGMIKPLPGTITSQKLALARRGLRNVLFAHSDLSGMSLFEEAHFWGVTAARTAHDRL